MAETESVPPKPLKNAKRAVVRVDGPNVATFYVNNINIDVTSLDVRFRLGLIQGVDDKTIQVTELAHVYMSHVHFKALEEAMRTSARAVEQVEAMRGAMNAETKKTK